MEHSARPAPDEGGSTNNANNWPAILTRAHRKRALNPLEFAERHCPRASQLAIHAPSSKRRIDPSATFTPVLAASTIRNGGSKAPFNSAERRIIITDNPQRRHLARRRPVMPMECLDESHRYRYVKGQRGW